MKSLKFHSAFIKVVAMLWLLAYTTGIGAQQADNPAATISQETSDQSKARPDRKPPAETDYIEAFPENGETSYKIYRKDNPDNPCDRRYDTYDYQETWYDKSQIFINSKFCEPALWFDNFFADDRIFKEGVAGTYVRWRNEFTYDEEEYFSFKSSLNFSVELPSTENRLRLTFQGDEDEDLRDIAPGNGSSTANSLGLLLNLIETPRSKFNANLTLSPKLRLRYRYTYPMYDNVILRFTQELQRDKAVHSARTLFDYEYIVKRDFLFRSSTEGVVSEEFDGVDWLQAFVLFQRVNNKTSLSYEAGINGVTEPWKLATNYRLGVRFRKNFHREWLFYEIAPEYTWPITLDDERTKIEIERRSKWLLFFRLEVHFGNAHETRYQSYL